MALQRHECRPKGGLAQLYTDDGSDWHRNVGRKYSLVVSKEHYYMNKHVMYAHILNSNRFTTAGWLDVFSTVRGTGQSVYDAWDAPVGTSVLHNKCPVLEMWASLPIKRVSILVLHTSHNSLRQGSGYGCYPRCSGCETRVEPAKTFSTRAAKHIN